MKQIQRTFSIIGILACAMLLCATALSQGSPVPRLQLHENTDGYCATAQVPEAPEDNGTVPILLHVAGGELPPGSYAGSVTISTEGSTLRLVSPVDTAVGTATQADTTAPGNVPLMTTVGILVVVVAVLGIVFIAIRAGYISRNPLKRRRHFK